MRVISLTSMNKSQEFVKGYNVNLKQEVSTRLDAFWRRKRRGVRVYLWSIIAIRVVGLWVI